MGCGRGVSHAWVAVDEYHEGDITGIDVIATYLIGRVEEALGLARTPLDFSILVSELFAHGHHEAAQGVIRNHLPKVDLTDPYPYQDPYHSARVLLWTGRLTEAEDVLRRYLERRELDERPTRWHDWALLVEVILAKGDREEALRISDHVAELETRGPKQFNQAMILMHLGDRSGALEVMRPIFDLQRTPTPLLRRLHRIGPVSQTGPQSLAAYAPFQELVGRPPPLPN